MFTRHHLSRLGILLLALFAATGAWAIPTCETDCHELTPCDQICQPQGCTHYSTCAGYVCDEPQFPWPPAGGLQLFSALDADPAPVSAPPAEAVEADATADAPADATAPDQTSAD